MTGRQKISNRIITLSRKLFAGTFVQKSGFTTAIYRKVFQMGYGRHDVTATFRGVKLTAPASDATIVPGLVIGFYETIEVDIFERLCANSRTVLDVGANVGLYSCLAAHASTNTQIVAFEPIEQNLKYLRRNIHENGFDSRASVEPVAVGDTSGTLEIFLANDNIGTHSSSLQNTHGSKASVKVPMITLDSYVAEHALTSVDLLKIDVEGYDVAVLRGAASILRTYKPTLFAEFMPHGLANCGFSHLEFLDIVFDVYDHVYVLDEAAGTMRACVRDELIKTREAHQNTNLIATANAEHASVIDARQLATK